MLQRWTCWCQGWVVVEGVAEKGLVVMLVYCGRVATSQMNFIWWTLGFFFYFTSFFSSCSAAGALSLLSNTFFWFYWNWRKDKDWLKVYPLRDSNRMTYERDLQLMLLTSGDSLKYSNNTIICFSFTQHSSTKNIVIYFSLVYISTWQALNKSSFQVHQVLLCIEFRSFPFMNM